MNTKKLNLFLFWVIISFLFVFWCNKTQDYNEDYSKYNYKITHSVKERLYDQVEFFWDESKYLEKYNELISQWYKCIKDDNAMQWELICYNVKWYSHEYEISWFKVKIIWYNEVMNNMAHNPWILDKNIVSPFILSGNTVYDTYLSWRSYVQYFEFKEWETVESVLSKAKASNIWGLTFDDKIWINKDWTWKYLLSFSKSIWRINEYMDLLYYFNPDKNYYYVINYGGDCQPWPCGLSRHKIELFYEWK